MEEIADMAELSVGTLYLYFKSKEEIYISLLFESIDRFTREIAKIEEGASMPSEKARRLWDYFLFFYRKNPALFQIVMFLNHAGLSQALSQDTIRAINEASGRNFAALEQILKGWVAEACPSASELRDLSLLFWSLFVGIVSFAKTRENLGLPSRLQALHAKAWEILERGLKEEPSRTS